MKALVTGGAGFIGSHVVDKLRDKGIEVMVYDMIRPTFRSDVEFYQGSILDYDSIRMALVGIDVVFHLVAIADVKDVFDDPIYADSINVRGTINVLEAARRNSAIKRVVYASTVWVYGDCEDEAVNEATPLPPPAHLYTATKLASEYYCSAYSRLYDLDVTILRYGVPYGPRARPGAVLPIFVGKALRGEPLTIAGDGSQFRKFIYVEDLAEGNVLALKSIAKNKIYNIDGREKVTIKQIAETVQKLIGDVKIESIPVRPGDFSGKQISSELAREELGWEPKVSFEEGVRRYIEWYKQEQEDKDS
jgi:UDP-glucose 4-epimerase